MITILYFKGNRDYIDYLNKKGYNVRHENGKIDIKSLDACMRKAENFKTRILMKQKELERVTQGGNTDHKEESYNTLVVNLNIGLGFTLNPDTLLLCEYNTYVKHLKEKLAAQKKSLANRK